MVLQHFDEIMNRYKGHYILVADQILYAVQDSEDLGNFYKNLREKGVDVSTGFSWYVPKDEDPEEIKKYWRYPPHFVNID